MNPNDVQQPGQPQSQSPQPADPHRPDNYAWQQGLGMEDPDNRIIPVPGASKNTMPAWQEPQERTQPQLPPPMQPLPLQEAPAFSSEPPIPPAAPSPPPLPPEEPPVQPVVQAPPRKRSKKPFVIVTILLFAVTLGALGYFIFSKPEEAKEDKKDSKPATTTPAPSVSDVVEESTDTISQGTTELSTLEMIKLNTPSPIDGYDLLIQGDTFARYTSKANSKCELGFGTLTETELAGSNLQDIIERQLQALRDSGATIEGPSAGTALTLPDSVQATQKYSLPTLTFEVTKDNVKAKSRYSAAMLKSGKRAVINRTCYTDDGATAVSDADMAALDATAAKVTVTKQ